MASPAGPSSTRAGNVTGSRPEGSAAPTSMSASVSAPPRPGTGEHGPGRAAHRHVDGGARVDDHHGATVHLEHRLDQLALAAGERQVGPVVTLGLPLPVGSHDDHGDVGRRGGCHRALELVAGVRRRCPDPRPMIGDETNAAKCRLSGGRRRRRGQRPLDGLAAGAVEARAAPGRSCRRRRRRRRAGPPARRSRARAATPRQSGTNVADRRTQQCPMVGSGCGGPIHSTRAVCADPSPPACRRGSGLSKYSIRSVSSREQSQVDGRQARVDPAPDLGDDGWHRERPPAPRPPVAAGGASPPNCRRPWPAGPRWGR